MTRLALLLALAFCVVRPASARSEESAVPTPPAAQEIRITVDGGYQPSLPVAVAGVPIKLIFTKKDYSGCTKEVVLPSVGIRKQLPRGQDVVIELPAQAAGEIAFQCGMNMVKGKIIVRAKE